MVVALVMAMAMAIYALAPGTLVLLAFDCALLHTTFRPVCRVPEPDPDPLAPAFRHIMCIIYNWIYTIHSLHKLKL